MTKTGIANLACQRLGIELVITNVDTDTSQEAISIKTVFDQERDAVMRSLDWPWATKYVALGLVAGTSTTPANNDWQYSYRYPPDCLRARRLTIQGDRTSAERLPFAVGRDDTGRLIFTDQVEAELEYTMQITVASEFDALFASMLAWRIAATVGFARQRVPQSAERAAQMFRYEWQVAGGSALNERQGDPALDAEWIRARA